MTDKKPDRDFWKRVKEAFEPILALDYDGTLAPFKVQRMEALPLPEVPEILDSIINKGNTRLAVISGRPISELDELVGGLSAKLLVVGSHGWEWRPPGEDTVVHAPAKEVADRLDRGFDRALALGQDELFDAKEVISRVERKAASVAVHVRGLEPGRAGAWLSGTKNQWMALVAGDVELLEFDGGIELRARGKDKGSVIKELVEDFPRSEMVVYIGDDRTDEDAFRALPDFGVGIKVGGPDIETAASLRLDDCEAVAEFLADWDRTAA